MQSQHVSATVRACIGQGITQGKCEWTHIAPHRTPHRHTYTHTVFAAGEYLAAVDPSITLRTYSSMSAGESGTGSSVGGSSVGGVCAGDRDQQMCPNLASLGRIRGS